MQVAGCAVHIKWRVKCAAQWGLLQVCLLSDAAVKGETRDASGGESAAGLSARTVTHFTQLNTEQTG